jgi:pimeloyl-ACP methyl ester carboxylesterase
VVKPHGVQNHREPQGSDFTHKLRNLSIPVLVIAGDRDLVSPATLELTRRSCRYATP